MINTKLNKEIIKLIKELKKTNYRRYAFSSI